MSEYWQRVRAFSPSLRRLMLAAVCMLAVWSGLMAVLYNLYLLRLGFDARTIGLLGGLGALVWGLAALPAGLLSNRIGLRNSLVATRYISVRASLLPADKVVEEAAFDKYDYIRNAYLQHRRSEIFDGELPHEAVDEESSQ
mgnify:CR=1 FL=1